MVSCACFSLAVSCHNEVETFKNIYAQYTQMLTFTQELAIYLFIVNSK